MRRRITLIAALIAGAVLVLIGVAVVVVVRAELYENLDRSLDQRAADVDASTRAEVRPVLLASDLEDHFAQLLDADGRVLAATENAADVPADWPLPERGTTVFTTSGVPIEDDAYRVLVRTSDVDGVRRFTVVGENVDDLRDTIRTLVIALAVVVPLASAVLSVAVWWLVGRTLRPVDAIRSEVDEIAFDQLSRRVPAPGTGDEVDQLADTMNRMLDRLDRSSRQQRRFVADASHELRTPLTRMRTQIEVELLRPSDDPEDVLTSLLADTAEMQQLVDDLLFLARRDASVHDRFAPVDVDVIVDDEVRLARADADITIDAARVAPVELVAAERDLRRLVRNLLSNAVRHASAAVVVALRPVPSGIELSVEDDGPGIAPDDRARVFERFVRLDDARGAGSGGSGLGLAIVDEIVRAHGGAIRIEDGDAGGARFVVTLPTTLDAEDVDTTT